MKSKIYLFLALFLSVNYAIGQIFYVENFDNPGYPANLPGNSYWTFFNEIHPDQNTWEKFIPGDGYAYLKVDADITNDLDDVHPYQTLVFGGVRENHKLEVRMKGAIVDGGLVAFLFTYTQTGSIFNEVDIEVVAQDRDADKHEIEAPNGWTDARFNTWLDADEITTLPFSGSAKAVVNANDEKISLKDNEFHTYTIEWREDEVDFYIDHVLQEAFTTNVAKGFSEVIIGFRNLPWAGEFKWTGEHTLVIDYFKIEPLQAKEILSTNSDNLDEELGLKLYPNPSRNFINIAVSNNQKIEKIEVFNTLSSNVLKINGSQKNVDISNLSKGIYFLKAYFENGKTMTKKIVKN